MRRSFLLSGFLGCILLLACSKPPTDPGKNDAPATGGDERPRQQAGPGASVAAKDFEIVSYRIEDRATGLRLLGEVANRGPVAAGVALQASIHGVDETASDELQFWPAESRNIPPGASEPFNVSLPGARVASVQLEPVAARTWAENADRKNFEIVSYRVVDEASGTRLMGMVRNNGATAAGVELQGVARDGSGALVEELRFWPAEGRSIQPGGTASFDVAGPKPGTRALALRVLAARTQPDEATSPASTEDWFIDRLSPEEISPG